MKKNRKLVLDIETTGFNKKGSFYKNHRIIEIGIIELINRKMTGNFLHYYLNPDRDIDADAYKIHGISKNFLSNCVRFKSIFKKLLDFLDKSEIIVHNAAFDIEFINYEFFLLKKKLLNINNYCAIFDTLTLARNLFPGKKNNLNALCKRYKIPISNRKLHGALLDAKLLAKVYLYMTSEQKSFSLFNDSKNFIQKKPIINKSFLNQQDFPIIYANSKEIIQHLEYFKNIKKKI